MGRGKLLGKRPRKMEGYFEKEKCNPVKNIVWLCNVISFM